MSGGRVLTADGELVPRWTYEQQHKHEVAMSARDRAWDRALSQGLTHAAAAEVARRAYADAERRYERGY